MKKLQVTKRTRGAIAIVNAQKHIITHSVKIKVYKLGKPLTCLEKIYSSYFIDDSILFEFMESLASIYAHSAHTTETGHVYLECGKYTVKLVGDDAEFYYEITNNGIRCIDITPNELLPKNNYLNVVPLSDKLNHCVTYKDPTEDIHPKPIEFNSGEYTLTPDTTDTMSDNRMKAYDLFVRDLKNSLGIKEPKWGDVDKSVAEFIKE